MSVSTFFELKNDRCTAAACVLGALSDNTRGFLTLHTDSMWNCGTSACCGKVSSLFGNSLIRGRSVQRIRRDVREEEGTQLGVYLRRQSSVNPIPSLSIPSDRFRLGNGQTTSHIHASFSSEFIHISIPILFPWAFRGTQSVVKHPSSRFIMKFLFFLMWPSYHCPANHASATVP